MPVLTLIHPRALCSIWDTSHLPRGSISTCSIQSSCRVCRCFLRGWASTDERIGDENQACDIRRAFADQSGCAVQESGCPDGTALNSPAFSRKLEPEQAGIRRTFIRAHVITGIAAVVTGLLVYAGSILARSNAILSTPGMSLVAMVFLGGLGGLLRGGLLSLRPDHYRVIAVVRRAIKEDQWALVIHPVIQLDQSLKMLRARGNRVVRSL